MVTRTEDFFETPADLPALFSRGVAGDRESYTLFLQGCASILRRFTGRRVPSRDVEDVVQEILISLHKARHTHDGRRPLMPWVLAIAHFRINDYLRRHYARARHDAGSSIVPFVCADDAESIETLLKDVPARQRRILTMLYVEGYTAKETGAQLNMKESAVKVAAHRAIKKIREKMGHPS